MTVDQGGASADAPLSLPAKLRQLAAERPDAIGLRFIALDGSEPAFSYAELNRRSSQLAAALAERGVVTGDVVALGLRNSPQLVLAALATWKLGATPVPVRWDVPDWELERVREAINGRVFLGAADLGWIDETENAPVPDLPDQISPRVQGICSSGSTGNPKIIVMERPAVYREVVTTPFIAAWGVTVPRPETILVPAPMYHANGFAPLQHLFAGDQLVVLEKFDAARVVDVIERYRVSTFTATPTMLQRIAALPDIDDRDLTSIQWIIQGAALMPRTLMHRWIGLIGPEKIVSIYGMTEALGLTALRGDEWLEHQGSVGRGLGDTEMRVLGPDGEVLPLGEIGDIYLRSATSPAYTYVGDAPRLPSTPDGFASAGDLGYLDADGYLYLVDRRVDMIVTGGANVFPAEVEAAIIDHPGVSDVVVVGLRDESWGRRVHAIIAPTDAAAPPSTEEIRTFTRSRLAAYKVPKTVEVVDAIPRSEATKVNRGALVKARGG
ncbi:AMP-binding protein [Frankia sp. AgPm24]|uniref:class I adenylate-forming enzyme family protein n=1 Tax=Frankia sp. AgPm24 TaxID=631128 RepID=UPI00200BE3B5|nr:AMP-binding protein [Frankia sp. AgPm24]MCK9923307.1 AMP-binding protein [Frankia sp. AgPm24]